MPKGVYERKPCSDIRRESLRAGQLNSSHSRLGKYRTDTPEYVLVHQRMKKLKTGECTECGAIRKTEMSLIHGCGALISKYRGKIYSVNPEDYVEMCVPCHRRYDMRGGNA